MYPISKEMETFDMFSNFNTDKENIPSITLSISMVMTTSALGRWFACRVSRVCRVNYIYVVYS